MAKARTLVGLDVHATKVAAAVLDVETGELAFFSMTPDIADVAGLCAGLPGPVQAAYEAEIIALLPGSPWSVQCSRLRCMRGLDTLTAVGLCAEVGDFASFRKPAQLMSYVGLVPSETSSGQQRRLGSITKTGSAHARRLLVEAAWHYRKRPRIGTTLTERQAGQPPEAIAIAWFAQRRLHRTWTRLEQRNKRRTLIAVAAARELAGFCWAICQIE